MLTYEDGPDEAELDRQVAEILGWKDFKLRPGGVGYLGKRPRFEGKREQVPNYSTQPWRILDHLIPERCVEFARGVVSVRLRWDGLTSNVALPVKKGQEWRWPRALALAFVLAYKDCCTCVDPPGDHSFADPLAHDLTCLYRKRSAA